jgi:hypothetical protein
MRVDMRRALAGVLAPSKFASRLLQAAEEGGAAIHTG